jgi:hypothetical protein
VDCAGDDVGDVQCGRTEKWVVPFFETSGAGHVDDVIPLVSIFGRTRGILPLVQRPGEESEVTSKLKAKEMMT